VKSCEASLPVVSGCVDKHGVAPPSEDIMTQPVLLERDGFVATITINRPETRNAISDDDVIDALVAAVQEVDSDPGLRVAIVTGTGSSFSSGGNLKKMIEDGMSHMPPPQTRQSYKRGIQRIPLAFEAVEIPLIAAVNGPAIGAGCDLACMCDIRIAGESARFAESFVKVGIVPGDGGAFLLQRVVGYARAAEMALTGDQLNASEALAFGLVSRVVPDAKLLATARDIADRIAANPPIAVRMTKRLLREAQHSRLESVLDYSAALQAIAHTTHDHAEAVVAFAARRAPRFSGT